MSAVNYPPLNASPGGQKLFVLSVVFEVLSIFTIILRLISRSLKSKSLVFNDYAAMVALALSSGNNSVCWIGVYWAGIGHHVVDVNPEYRWRVLMCFFVAQPMWAAANTAVKFSILHLYITAFPSMLLRRICYITMAISAAYFIHVILESMLLCKPVRYSWDKTIPGSCSPYSITAYVVSGTINISIDILILILPMPKLWTLNFSWQKKVAIMSMFSLGAVICIISALRIVSLSRIDFTDLNLAVTTPAIWSMLEPSLSVINTTLPVLRPLGPWVANSLIFRHARRLYRHICTSKSKRNQPYRDDGECTSEAKSPSVEVNERVADPTDLLFPISSFGTGNDLESQPLGSQTSRIELSYGQRAIT